ncbi:hypothetical protein ASPCAL12996 [Aspergillus calidoustus]|uniref:Uncharacterized protein n=1 Tax=Aspergillus calidoustus TaxID=454130 RepID=A0A0U5CGT8_ASPCI|nr:hypothetical protein ASPCAL12996 [Aspergillus calidoustus]
MPSERLLSPLLEYGSDRAPTAQKGNTRILGAENNGFGSLKDSSVEKDHETTDSIEPAPDKASPFTNEFFSDLAKAIIRSFPFEQFAKDHACEVNDVVQAIQATIVKPFSKPLGQAHKDQGSLGLKQALPSRTGEVKQTPGHAEGRAVPATPRNKGLLYSQGLVDRGSARRKTLVPLGVGRTLVYQDIYGNYIPVRPVKDSPPDPRQYKRRKVKNGRQDLRYAPIDRPLETPQREKSDYEFS